MTGLMLKNCVHFCFVEDVAVFVDLERDVYVGLEPEKASALREALSSSQLSPASTVVMEELASRGLVTKDIHRGRPFAATEIERAQATLLDPFDSQDRPSQSRLWLRSCPQLLCASSRARRMLRSRPLSDVVRHVRTRREGTSQETPFVWDVAREVVRDFQLLRSLCYTAENRCLVDSLTLLEFMAQFRLFPKWVFGVKVMPFEAHAWVQEGPYVLNDSLKNVEAFVPIVAF